MNEKNVSFVFNSKSKKMAFNGECDQLQKNIRFTCVSSCVTCQFIWASKSFATSNPLAWEGFFTGVCPQMRFQMRTFAIDFSAASVQTLVRLAIIVRHRHFIITCDNSIVDRKVAHKLWRIASNRRTDKICRASCITAVWSCYLFGNIDADSLLFLLLFHDERHI